MAEFWRSTVLPHVEARRSCQENSCYRQHTHDAFSIGLIEEGTSVFTGALDGRIVLQPGDVVVIPAGQVHACNPEDGRWLYQMVHMDQEWVASLLPAGEASGLFMGISVLRHPGLRPLVTAFSDAVFADERRERIEEALVGLCRGLETVPAAHVVPGDVDPELRRRLSPVMQRLRDDDVNPALSDLAELVDMSTYQLVRAMRRATGLAPLAWRQNARINKARHLLRDGAPIADTAYALGFTDQSHFHRVFRSHVAASPGAYRG